MKKKIFRSNQMPANRPQQIQVDFSKATKLECTCGCKYFEAAVEVGILSSLVSPNGQDMVVHRQIWVCRKCGEPLNIVKPELPGKA